MSSRGGGAGVGSVLVQSSITGALVRGACTEEYCMLIWQAVQ